MWKRVLTLMALSTSGYAGTIQVVPVEATPEPDHARTVILYPKENEVESEKRINLQVLVEGFGLGVNSQFDRAKEIYNHSIGQVLHVAIDNYPHFDTTTTSLDALDQTEDYFDQTIEMKIPIALDSGKHIMRVFPVRSYGESLKGEKTLATRTFYVQSKKDTPGMDASKPFLTYNEPQGDIGLMRDGAVLLDFLVTNCALSEDGYKVRAKIDNNMERTFSSLGPYYVYGLSRGTHQVELELLDRNGKRVEGVLNSVKRPFTIR